jgi:molybdopterin converting factor small subunit
MPSVKIPPPYRGPTRGLAAVPVEAGTVGGCLEAVCAQFPGFSEQIFDAAGGVHGFVSLFVNGEEVDRAALDEPVSGDDELEILAAIAGG